MDTHMRITEITVSVVPEGDVNRHLFEVKVVYRGDGRYAVTHLGYCLGADGEWEYEPHPSAREDDWLATHRFDHDTAYRLAIEVAPGIECNGLTAAEYMARRKAGG